MIMRSLTCFITAITSVFLSQAQAKLPFNGFKNVSHHFQNVYYSPVLGMSALESGIVKSIRFGFVENEVIDQDNGLRVFLADQITNPHGNIARILFPSVTGELGIDASTQETISNYATPEFMATIMAVTSKMRQLIQTQQEAELCSLLESVWETYFCAATRQTKSDILASVKMRSNHQTNLKTKIEELFQHIRAAIIDEEQGTSLLPKYSAEQLTSAFVCLKLNTRDELEKYLTALYLKDSENLIFKDLSHLSPSSSQTPFANIALFDLKDEASYMELLKTNLYGTSEAISSSSAAASSSAPSACTFDDHSKILDALYALTVMPNFYKSTPYINAAPCYGPTGFVEGIDAAINHKRGTFSDLIENSLRIMLNIMMFDANKHDFNLAFLENAVGPRVAIFKDFFEHYQTVTNVGSTLQSTRTQWNRVVGDLNSFKSADWESSSSSSSAFHDVMLSSAPVRYLQGNNDLDSGFANILRVFEKVLGLSLLPSFPERASIEEQMEAIQQGFMTLFKFISPEKKVELSFSNLLSKPGDLAGSMTVTVDRKFQFTVYEHYVPHVFIKSIRSIIPQASRDQERLTILEDYEIVLQNETLATVLLLQQNPKRLIYNQFYNLFSTPIHGNREIFSFTEKLGEMPDDCRFNLPLKFVLSQTSWNNSLSGPLILRTLKNMFNRKYAQTIFDGLKYFKVSSKYPIEYVENNMKNLMYIEFSDTSNINIQNEMPTIKEIFLAEGVKKTPNLSKIPNLERLKLTGTQISFLEFNQLMPNLKELYLPRTITDLSQVRGMENLQALERLCLSGTHITALEFTQPMPILKNIDCPITLESIKGMENLPALQRLNLVCMPILTLEFTQPMHHLEKLYLPLVLKSLTGVENLTALEVLNLKETKIPSLEVSKPMPNLKTILLPSAMQSCILYGKEEDWEIKHWDLNGRCLAEGGKRSICVSDPRTVRFTFLGDLEGAASTSTPPN